jgi:predicted metal-binding membrane protein
MVMNSVPRTSPLVLWSALLCISALAWAITIHGALAMGNMPGTMGMGIVSFLIMWTIMMAGMMLPSLAPMASIFIRSILIQSGGLARVLAVSRFVTGYLLVWAAFGLAAYAIAWMISLSLREMPGVLDWFAAAVLILCGIYQFTPLKDLCLKHCRSPLDFIFKFGNYHGKFREILVGMYHGAYCTGCCLGLMVVMVIAGVMNIVWMVALALIIFIEKVWRYGKEFSYLVGVTLILLGCMLPWWPGILTGM